MKQCLFPVGFLLCPIKNIYFHKRSIILKTCEAVFAMIYLGDSETYRSLFGKRRLTIPLCITLTSERKIRSRLQEEDGCKSTNICTAKPLSQGYSTGPKTAANKQRNKQLISGLWSPPYILSFQGPLPPYLVIVPLYNFQEQSRPVLHRFCENL